MIVEDDEAIADEVQRALEAQGYDAVVLGTGRSALASIESAAPDLVLLDLGLPDLDGVQVCRLLRGRLPDTPIVIVTARDDDVDIVVGLDAGATDYIVKPFTMPVLLARVRAHLRTQHSGPGAEILNLDSLRIDRGAHRAFVADVELDLRPKEFALLRTFAEAAGRVLTRERLLDEVWGLRWETSTKTLDMHVHALRRKLGERPDGAAWITTIRSVGYRFEPM
jgi:DNA-binding response OmpR family regulator